jgi:hypothetical protein
MVVSRHRSAGQDHNLLIANEFFENTTRFKQFGTKITNQNCIQEAIKSRLNLGNACYHCVLSILSSRRLYKNLKIKIYKTIIFHVVLWV